jgi:hypothetical protein
MMSETKKPATAPDSLPHHGIHPDAGQEESKGLPHSDREKTETVPVRDVGRDI